MDEIVNVRVPIFELAGRIGPPELGDRDAHCPLGLALEAGGPFLRREADDRRLGRIPASFAAARRDGFRRRTGFGPGRGLGSGSCALLRRGHGLRIHRPVPPGPPTQESNPTKTSRFAQANAASSPTGVRPFPTWRSRNKANSLTHNTRWHPPPTIAAAWDYSIIKNHQAIPSAQVPHILRSPPWRLAKHPCLFSRGLRANRHCSQRSGDRLTTSKQTAATKQSIGAKIFSVVDQTPNVSGESRLKLGA